MKKRHLALAVCLAAGLLASSVTAAFASGDGTSATKVTVGDAKAKAGETVTLTVDLAGNTGFTNFDWIIKYGNPNDANFGTANDYLTLQKVETADGNVCDAGNLVYKADTNMISFANTEAITSNGTMFTMTFKVADNAPAGTEILVWAWAKDSSGTGEGSGQGGTGEGSGQGGTGEGSGQGGTGEGSGQGGTGEGSGQGGTGEGSGQGGTTGGNTTGGNTTGGNTTGGNTTGGNTTGGNTTGGNTTGGNTTGGNTTGGNTTGGNTTGGNTTGGNTTGGNTTGGNTTGGNTTGGNTTGGNTTGGNTTGGNTTGGNTTGGNTTGGNTTGGNTTGGGTTGGDATDGDSTGSSSTGGGTTGGDATDGDSTGSSSTGGGTTGGDATDGDSTGDGETDGTGDWVETFSMSGNSGVMVLSLDADSTTAADTNSKYFEDGFFNNGESVGVTTYAGKVTIEKKNEGPGGGGGGSGSGGGGGGSSKVDKDNSGRTGTILPEPSFTDVPKDAWYYDAVAWAESKGITNGSESGLFAPMDFCTRGQIVTFLWRMVGSPEPTTNTTFTDVPLSSYYHKAISWAQENGVALGFTDTEFGPDQTCTRAQAVAFLHRYSDSPAATTQTTYADVPSDAYYAGAVSWAQENGITEGVGENLFGSGEKCNRAQIITFLYRMAMKFNL